MHVPVPVIPARESFAAAVRMLLLNETGCLLVPPDPGNGDAWGIVTKTDLLQHVMARRRNPWQLRVRDVMTTPVLSVGPDTLLEDCINVLVDQRVERLVVFDGGKPVGVVYAAVVVAALEERGWESAIVPARRRLARERIARHLRPHVAQPDDLADEILAELHL